MTTINRIVDFPKPPKRRSFETLSNANPQSRGRRFVINALR